MSGEVVDAAIVGYGPVGATLANLLGQLGRRVEVFESTTSAYHLPALPTSTVR